MRNVCHFSSVHPRLDQRIFQKECVSLAQHGYRVTYVVCDGRGTETRDGITIHDLGPLPRSRWGRVLFGSWRIFWHVLGLRAQLNHFHDPELLGVGFALKLFGRRVIYDVHEDVARSLDNRFWLPRSVKRPLGWAIEILEAAAWRFFDAIIVVTPAIRARFPVKKVALIRNWPRLDGKIPAARRSLPPSPLRFIYVGNVSRERGAIQMVQAINQLPVAARACLTIVGHVYPNELMQEMKAHDSAGVVAFLGWQDQAAISLELARAFAGLVLLHPSRAYQEAYPVKLFEYLAAGLPVIASDFPLWREVLDPHGCAVFAPPLEPDAIAAAMLRLLDAPLVAQDMGRRGQQAAYSQFRWQTEERVLLDTYRTILE